MSDFSQFANYPSLAGRVTFITGGATGIGAELVRQFARQQARVAFIDIQDTAAKNLVEAVVAEGSPMPHYIQCDVRDVEALQFGDRSCRARARTGDGAHQQRRK